VNRTKKISFAIILLCVAIIAIAVPVALAQTEPAGPPELPFEVMHGIWALAVATPISLIIAFINCIAGYFSKTGPEDFKLEYFIYTILISLVIGLLTVYMGWSYTMIETWLANGFLTWYIWKGTKIIAGAIAKHANWTPQPTGPPELAATKTQA
jgi:hypothetical protein